jgi:hypothetical protein
MSEQPQQIKIRLEPYWCKPSSNHGNPIELTIKTPTGQQYTLKEHTTQHDTFRTKFNDNANVVLVPMQIQVKDEELSGLLQHVIKQRHSASTTTNNNRIYTIIEPNVDRDKNTVLFRVIIIVAAENLRYKLNNPGRMASHAIFFDYDKLTPLSDTHNDEMYKEMVKLEDHWLKNLSKNLSSGTPLSLQQDVQRDYIKQKLADAAKTLAADENDNTHTKQQQTIKLSQLFVRTLYALGYHSVLKEHAYHSNEGEWRFIFENANENHRHVSLVGIERNKDTPATVMFAVYSPRQDSGKISNNNVRIYKMRYHMFLKSETYIFPDGQNDTHFIEYDTIDQSSTLTDNLMIRAHNAFFPLTEGNFHDLEYIITKQKYSTSSEPVLSITVKSGPDRGTNNELSLFITDEGIKNLLNARCEELTFTDVSDPKRKYTLKLNPRSDDSVQPVIENIHEYDTRHDDENKDVHLLTLQLQQYSKRTRMWEYTRSWMNRDSKQVYPYTRQVSLTGTNIPAEINEYLKIVQTNSFEGMTNWNKQRAHSNNNGSESHLDDITFTASLGKSGSKVECVMKTPLGSGGSNARRHTRRHINPRTTRPPKHTQRTPTTPAK